MHSRCDASRVVEPMPVLPPHELLTKECGTTAMPRLLEEATARGELPRTYWTHPVVEAARGSDEPVYPLAVYMDGVAFARADSVLGVWCYCMPTGKRHLLAVYRKTELCQCGCHHWCSLFVLHAWLAWSLTALAEGAWPSTRHDGTAFTAEENWRQERAGQRFGFRVAVVVLKGDWAEYASSLGFPTWASNSDPCPHRRATSAEMHLLSNYSSVSMPRATKTMDEYEAACDMCEKQVVIQPNDLSLLRASLEYDKRKSAYAARGRALTQPLPHLGLAAHDRVEPSP
eukprot:7643099-Alexandrium_andersonii.AAC.1